MRQGGGGDTRTDAQSRFIYKDEMCQCNCLKAGKPYAGTQYFGKCSCGDNLPSNDYSLEERYCNSQCKGNSSQMCGGFERNSIYGTGLENL